MLGFDVLARMDVSPRDGDGEDAGSLSRTDVERRVAHVSRVLGPRAERRERAEDRLRSGLVALRVVAADDDVELPELGNRLERERDRLLPLGRHDAEPASLRAELAENVR